MDVKEAFELALDALINPDQSVMIGPGRASYFKKFNHVTGKFLDQPWVFYSVEAKFHVSDPYNGCPTLHHIALVGIKCKYRKHVIFVI